MTALINFFLGISFFALIFVISFLVKKKPLAYYFFIGSYIIFLFSLLNNLITANRLILDWPHLFRVTSPFQFLLGPLSYFFCRATLKPYQKYSYFDLLHSIPFFLAVIGLIPVYMLSAEEKIQILNPKSEYGGSINRVDAFGLPFFTIARIKFGIFLVYMLYLWKMLINYKKNALSSLKEKNKLLIVWINFDTFFKTFFGLVIFVTAWWTQNISLAAVLQVCVIVFELVVSTAFLISSPSLLKGIIFDHEVYTDQKSFKDIQVQHLEEEIQKFDNLGAQEINQGDEILINNIDVYFQIEQPFLRQNFSLSELSSAISVPSRQISQAIKQKLGLSFPDYINQIRFNYLESLMKSQPQVLDFSIDALAKMAGFNSRSGFYKAFKKNEKYQNPSQMIEYYKEKSRT